MQRKEGRVVGGVGRSPKTLMTSLRVDVPLAQSLDKWINVAKCEEKNKPVDDILDSPKVERMWVASVGRETDE